MDTQGPSQQAIRELTHIGAMTARINNAERAKLLHIERARSEGASWRMIGVALGVSAQAAWERYNGHKRELDQAKQDYLPEDWPASGPLTTGRED